MKNIITTLSTGTLAGSVFFGHATVQLHDKSHQFTVCNHLIADQEMNFRAITKVKAGWNTIVEFKCKPENLWYHIGKHTQYVEVQIVGEKSSHWFGVYTTKGSLWMMIDVLLLDTCTVGDIHQSAPKMRCHDTWKQANAQTWACKAFVMNEEKKKAA